MVDVTQGFKVKNEKEITLCIFKGLEWKEFCLRFTNQTKAVRWMCPLTLRGLHFEALIFVSQADLRFSHHLMYSYVFRWSYLPKNTKTKANEQKKDLMKLLRFLFIMGKIVWMNRDGGILTTAWMKYVLGVATSGDNKQICFGFITGSLQNALLHRNTWQRWRRGEEMWTL